MNRAGKTLSPARAPDVRAHKYRQFETILSINKTMDFTHTLYVPVCFCTQACCCVFQNFVYIQARKTHWGKLLSAGSFFMHTDAEIKYYAAKGIIFYGKQFTDKVR